MNATENKIDFSPGIHEIFNYLFIWSWSTKLSMKLSMYVARIWIILTQNKSTVTYHYLLQWPTYIHKYVQKAILSKIPIKNNTFKMACLIVIFIISKSFNQQHKRLRLFLVNLLESQSQFGLRYNDSINDIIISKAFPTLYFSINRNIKQQLCIEILSSNNSILMIWGELHLLLAILFLPYFRR